MSVDGETVTLHAGRLRRAPDNNGLPIHGLLAAYPAMASTAGLRPEAHRRTGFRSAGRTASRASRSRIWSELTVELSDRTLTVSTTVTPTTDKAVPLVYGYHPYLQLPDVPRPSGRSSCRRCGT